ncbi:chaperonin 10-like protein, partial [Endogone sp. FLAS-F59071]
MDVSQRHGKYPPPPGASQILGVEVSGTVEEVGEDVKNFKIGDRVFGLMGGGGYASYAVMKHGIAMHIPDALTLQEAAAIPEVWFTAYQALHFVAGLKEGQDVLIHAAASGVGTAAIQLAKLAKAYV